MISSEDVRHVTFDKAFQGYRREDVDDYLKQVAQAMDDLAAQNDDLQKKLVMLAQRIEKYRTMENSLSTSMINAQRMGDSIIRESKQKAAEIIRSANIKAEALACGTWLMAATNCDFARLASSAATFAWRSSRSVSLIEVIS